MALRGGVRTVGLGLLATLVLIYGAVSFGGVEISWVLETLGFCLAMVVTTFAVALLACALIRVLRLRP